MNHDPLDKAYTQIETYLRSVPKPTVFELGMCDGYHTRMLHGWCNEPLYVGFEPDPRNVLKLKAQGIDRAIIFYPAAVGNVTGPAEFHLATADGQGGVGCSSLSEFTPVLTKEWPWLREQGTATVQSYRLDDFCHQFNVKYIDFLWMDVQGAERLVFEGAQNILQSTGMVWTEYDGGTLYKDSSTLSDILKWFPGWEVLADCGGDVLLFNPNYQRGREQLANKQQPLAQKL